MLYSAIHDGSCWNIQESKIQIIHNLNTTQKSKQRKYSKTKLAWFSRLLRHLARKQGGLIVQCPRTHMGSKFTVMAILKIIHVLYLVYGCVLSTVLLKRIMMIIITKSQMTSIELTSGSKHYKSSLDWIGLSSVLRPCQHSICYMGDGFYRSSYSNMYRAIMRQACYA